MISLTWLASILIWLLVIGLIFGLIVWVVSVIGVPEPYAKIIRVILAVIFIIIVIILLLNLIEGITIFRP